ncbi:F-box/kelch-repeat protein At3g23880-like [Papaver somniferum]|uniref:F-box/kelch-repeat protein At3g23880-like n=1 Tax=Papaver somniferum TaxID=3469 RepID=UPI000E6FEC89|nr:F-box/kelch-repeat protein At3g23880-like [Papaver somniferum]
MSSLPEEIHEEIFLRLPVESILTCKFVCKFWRDIISSPKFIKHHLNLNIQKNSHDPKSIFTGFYFECIQYPVALGYTVRYAPSCNGAFGMGDNRYERIQILGSCNGLICLRISSVGRYMFYVWNPSTGEYKEIPGRQPLGFRVLSSFDWHPFSYGFGYDCARDDYKFVRIGGNEIQVYTLGSDAWNNTRSTPYPNKGNNSNINGVTFNGALHWLCSTRETSTEVIVSFDISSETISYMPLPIETMPGSVSRADGLGVSRDCLCLYVALPNDDFEIWVM